MSPHRFFLTEPWAQNDADLLPLSADDLHHAVRVVRIAAGEEFEVVEPDGVGVWKVEAISATSAGIRARRIERIGPLAGGPPTPHIALFQGVAKGDKMDGIVRQAVELGVSEVVGVLTSRTVVRLDEGKREQRGIRWRRIAKSAAEQSRRASVPHIADPVEFAEALSLLAAYDGVVVLWEDHSGQGIAEALAPWLGDSSARIALMVGPEGGLSAEEVAALVDATGARVVSLGPTILRTETAALVALALALHASGGLGGSRD